MNHSMKLKGEKSVGTLGNTVYSCPSFGLVKPFVDEIQRKKLKTSTHSLHLLNANEGRGYTENEVNIHGLLSYPRNDYFDYQ